MIAELSLYATMVPFGCSWCVFLIIWNRDLSCFAPSMVHSALKILWRQCSEFACANIISSTSVGLRCTREKASNR
jgi:hypothetical protein